MTKPIWTVQKIEREPLAPYACRAANSKGRVYKESPHPLRTEFQRDKDRVVHSAAFRRLDYKTQVFVPKSCDHFRTRLTHTIEVAGISRTIARSLGLNEDLAETIALAHDIGHPPFGHSGEDYLNELMINHGGFNHNLNALNVVDCLEEKYPGYPGLNLSWETRSGLLKHRDLIVELDGKLLSPQPLLESQTADISDSLTYLAHDIDDGILSGLIDPLDLNDLKFWQLAMAHGDAQVISNNDERYIPFMIRNCIDMSVANVVITSTEKLQEFDIQSPADAEHQATVMITLNNQLTEASEELKNFLYKELYFHPDVMLGRKEAEQCLVGLFKHFINKPKDLGRRSQRRIKEVGLEKAVCDYLSMMTDRYALEQFQKYLVN